MTGELADLRRDLLAARDARQVRLDAFIARASGTRCVVAITTSIPGPDKKLDGTEVLIGAVLEQLDTLGWLGFASGRRRVGRGGAGGFPGAFPIPHDHGDDVLGEFIFFALDVEPRVVKRRYALIENHVPWGRLLDIDVYDAEGRPVSRADVGLPPRECLLCAEPARECMRLGRHAEAELRAGVEGALRFLRACLFDR